MKELKPRQSLVLDNWFAAGCGSKSDAMRKAGYTEQTAIKTQTAYFARPEMVSEIKLRREKIIEDHKRTMEWVIERLMRVADSGIVMAKFKKVTADGKLDWDFTNATLEELSLINDMNIDSYTEGKGESARKVKRFKLNVSDPKSALDSLARILGMFNDNMTIKGELSMVERLHAGRARVKRENLKELERVE